MEAPLVSIIVVLYNSGSYLEPCLEALASLEYRPIEFIFLDNGSSDDSVAVARKTARRCGLPCLVSELGRNLGFAAANNRGIELSRGEIVLLLNPDTQVYPDTVTALVDAFLEDRTVGVAGCKIYYPDRVTLQHAGGFVRDNGLTMHHGADERDEGQWDRAADVHYVTGAAMAALRPIFLRVGMFDQGYFPAYFEETDLCWCVRRVGYRVRYVPSARVVHLESVTTGKFTERYYYLYHRNRIRFLIKNFPRRFLIDRALPFEKKWRTMIDPEEQAGPLLKAEAANIRMLPRTLLARRRAERLLRVPYLEDTVSHFERSDPPGGEVPSTG